jgi:hypothetical protein
MPEGTEAETVGHIEAATAKEAVESAVKPWTRRPTDILLRYSSLPSGLAVVAYCENNRAALVDRSLLMPRQAELP